MLDKAASADQASWRDDHLWNSVNATAGNHVNVDSSLRGFAFGKSMRKAIAVGTVMLALVAGCSRGDSADTAVTDSAQPTVAQTCDRATVPKLPDAAIPPGFATVSKLI